MSKTTPATREPSPKVNRKAQIIAATRELLCEQGLTGTTTKAIAKAVPCSEGAIYVHFDNRAQLLLTVLEESLPAMLVPLKALKAKAGKATPRANLTTAVQGLLAFYESVAPMMCSLFAEPTLLASVRDSLMERGKGPHGGLARIASYIRQEQALGRVDAEVNAEAAARSIMAGAFFQVVTEKLVGLPKPAQLARQLVDFALR